MNIKILNKLSSMMSSNPSLALELPLLTQTVNGVFDLELTTVPTADTVELARYIDNLVLHKYFSEVWQPELKKYKYSGLSLIDEINNQKPRHVLDVGCGYNEFKGKIRNIVGLDPYNSRADYNTTLLEFQPSQKYDIAVCLGSINFGSSEKIIREVQKVIKLVEPGGLIYFRVNPGIQHDKPEARWINFYDWTPEFISSLAKTFFCELIQLRRDSNNRYYFVFKTKKIPGLRT